MVGMFIFGAAAGLIVGWNLLPQPEWAKNLWDKLVAKIKK